MAAPLLLLDYAGPRPAPPRTILGRCWRAIVRLITMTILIVFLTVRALLLLAGFTCVLVGLIFLTLGGKRSAARKLLEWRERFVDHVRLWAGDITRPLRRRRRRDGRHPVSVASLASP
jgi:hypothetical protein